MHDSSDNCHPQQAAPEEAGGEQEIERDERGDYRSPHVHGDHRLLGVADGRDDVADAEKVHYLLGDYRPAADLGHRDIDSAAKKREEQKREDQIGADPDPLIGIANEPDLDREKEEEQKKEEGEDEENCEREKIEAAHVLPSPIRYALEELPTQ